MRKTTICYAVATVLFTSLALFNCSKKADPAPAPATTTSGTTTNGTTTSGTTSGSTTHSTMGENTWKVDSDLYSLESSKMQVEKDNGTRTFSFSLGTFTGVNFIFKGTETLPSTGTYKLVSGLPKSANEVSVLAPGFSGYFSKTELNSNILLTNTSGVITIEAVNVAVAGPTGGSIIVSGKLNHDANPPVSANKKTGKGTYTIDGIIRNTTITTELLENQLYIYAAAVDSTTLFIIFGTPTWKDGTYQLNNSVPVDLGYSKTFLNVKSEKQYLDFGNYVGGQVNITGKKITMTSVVLQGFSFGSAKQLKVSCDFTLD